MYTKAELLDAIDQLNERHHTIQNCAKLAAVYSVLDHIEEEDKSATSVKSIVKTVMPNYDGEFGEAVSGVEIDGLMKVLSEHMEVVKLLHPREYQAVLDKIKEIP